MIRRKMRNLVITGYGYKVKRKGNLIKVSSVEGNLYFSPKEIEQLIIAGDVMVTSAAISLLLEYDVDIVFVRQRSGFFARVSKTIGDVYPDLWRKQMSLSSIRKLEIAREIVDTAIYNRIRMLQQLERNRDIDFSMDIDFLNRERKQVDNVSSPLSLMGVEGQASKIYFSSLSRVIPSVFQFTHRRKHPAVDPVNSMLDYGYTILLSKVTYALLLSGLNIYEGLLHESYRGRTALAFDLMEEFRQAIVDRVIITLIVRREVSIDDFELIEGMCRMKSDFRRMYLDALYTRFEQMYTYRDVEMEFQDIIVEQAKSLADAILNDRVYHGFRYR